MAKVDVDAFVQQYREEWCRKHLEDMKTARCFVCGAAYSWEKGVLLQQTNDQERHVCTEHQHLDTSTQDFDVTFYFNDSPYPRERQALVYQHLREDGRWNLINVPEWLQKTVKPEQLAMF